MKAGITVGTIVVAAAAAAVLTAAVAGRGTGTGAPAGGGNAAACAEFFQWQDSGGGTALLQDARRDAADLSLRDDLGQLLGDLAGGDSTAAPADEMAVEGDCWTLGYWSAR